MLAWTIHNTMQRAMRTVLEWPQSQATRKTINMNTNKYELQQTSRLGTVSKKLLGVGALTGFTGTQPRPRLLSWLRTYCIKVRIVNI